MKESKTDLLVIGAGPAGLGAAIYAARSALDFILVDKFMAGGQIVTTEYIENYPGFKGDISGFDLMQSMIEHAKSFSISIEENMSINSIKTGQSPDSGKDSKKKNIFLCSSKENNILARSLIIATGASPKRLSVKGENEFIGKGISFCATCDGALYMDREVMVVGGGNTAIQEALFLTKFAKKIYIIHRRDELRAVKLLQKRAFENKKIEFIWDSIVVEFKGGDRLEQILVKNVKTDSITEIKIDGVFEYIGIKPNSGIVDGLVDLDDDGFIITGPKMETSITGIFAAGDVRYTPLRQVITAVSDGAVAATYADMYLDDLL
jgi:thioredoxin reductase (NADPH)